MSFGWVVSAGVALVASVAAAALSPTGGVVTVRNPGPQAMRTVALDLPFGSTRAHLRCDGGTWRAIPYDTDGRGRAVFAVEVPSGGAASFRIEAYDNADWQICPKSRTPPWDVACPCCRTAAENPALARCLREVMRLDRAADAAWDGVRTEAEVAALRARLRKSFLGAIGGLPERTPLNAKVTGVVRREGYRIEKILFETEPGHYATGHLFVPDGVTAERPAPGLLVPCGHSTTGKLSKGYQHICVLAAKGGLVAFIYDPIDQGERWQGAKGTPCNPCGGHLDAGLRAHLIGWSQARFRIWDGIRALDVLASRPDVRADRLGVCGQSGGGTLSSYLFALDDRLGAAAPAGYITTMSRLAEHWGPQDCEQVVQGQLVNGLNHLALLAMRAPAPVCLTLVDQDAFPLDGSLATYGRLAALYRRLGAPEKAAYVREPGLHNYYELTMRGTVDWMRRWLAGETGPCDYGREDDCGLNGSPDGLVTPTGRVADLPGYRSSYDILGDELARRRRGRRPFTRADVIRLTGINPDAADAPDDDATFDCGRMAYWTRFHSPTQEIAMADWWLGTSYVKTRAELFIVRARAWSKAHGGARMDLRAQGDDAVAAAHARYLRPDLIGRLEFVDAPPSWERVFTDRSFNPESAVTSLVYDALPTYDWTDLMSEEPDMKGKER